MAGLTPKQIQSCRLVKKLGEGGMGAVFEGHHIHLPKRAAIKILHPVHSHHTEHLVRFFNEARASVLTHHPNIVEVYECGQTEDGTAFLIMEFLAAETLRAHLARSGPLGYAAIPLLFQVAQALEVVHEKGIVHRDLKPAQLPSRNENGTDWGKRREKRVDDPIPTFGCQSLHCSFCTAVGNQTRSRGISSPSSPEWA